MNFALASVAHDLLVWIKDAEVLRSDQDCSSYIEGEVLSTSVILRHRVAILVINCFGGFLA
jgi:hypothetical protein